VPYSNATRNNIEVKLSVTAADGKNYDVSRGVAPSCQQKDGRITMTTISKDAKLVTLINVFTVEPANQRLLLELLARDGARIERMAKLFGSTVEAPRHSPMSK